MHCQYNPDFEPGDASDLMPPGDTSPPTGESSKHKPRRVSTKRMSTNSRDSCDGGIGTLSSRRKSGQSRSPDVRRKASVAHSCAPQQSQLQLQLQDASQKTIDAPAIEVQEADESARLRRRLAEIAELCREFRGSCSADVPQLLDRICRIAESDEKEGAPELLSVQTDGIVYHV